MIVVVVPVPACPPCRVTAIVLVLAAEPISVAPPRASLTTLRSNMPGVPFAVPSSISRITATELILLALSPMSAILLSREVVAPVVAAVLDLDVVKGARNASARITGMPAPEALGPLVATGSPAPCSTAPEAVAEEELEVDAEGAEVRRLAPEAAGVFVWGVMPVGLLSLASFPSQCTVKLLAQ